MLSAIPVQLPFEVHPYAWIACVLFVAIATWSHTRPPEHGWKRFIQAIGESQASGWRALFRIPEPTAAQAARHAPRERVFWRIVYICSVAALGAYGLLSILVLTGVAKNPPTPLERMGQVNLDEYELVTEGHAIWMRKKSPATTQASEGE